MKKTTFILYSQTESYALKKEIGGSISMLRKILIGFLGIPLALISCSNPTTPEPPTTLPEPQPWVWQQVANFGGQPIRGAMAFTVGNAAYIVSGMADDCIPHNQVWKYDPTANAWTRKGNYPGTPIIEGVGFSIGQRGYICLGSTNGPAGAVADLWEYDAQADRWTQKTSFPGSPRSGSVAVTIGQKAYIFAGSSGALEKDIWEYDPQTDLWTRKTDCPGEGRFLPGGFAIGDKAYFGTGSISGPTYTVARDFWEYDPQADHWTRKADFPGAARDYAIGLSLGNRGYLSLGLLNIGTPLTLAKDVWEYDPQSDSWSQKTDFAGQARAMSIGFVLGSYLYLGTGNDANAQNLSDIWRARPSATGW
jgi:N-acetylneuraminic acid mutarotase